jgi:hypothetical protein
MICARAPWAEGSTHAEVVPLVSQGAQGSQLIAAAVGICPMIVVCDDVVRRLALAFEVVNMMEVGNMCGSTPSRFRAVCITWLGYGVGCCFEQVEMASLAS